jgi:hypothetical protein
MSSMATSHFKNEVVSTTSVKLPSCRGSASARRLRGSAAFGRRDSALIITAGVDTDGGAIKTRCRGRASAPGQTRVFATAALKADETVRPARLLQRLLSPQFGSKWLDELALGHILLGQELVLGHCGRSARGLADQCAPSANSDGDLPAEESS